VGSAHPTLAGQSIADITKNTLAFAVDIPNYGKLDIDTPPDLVLYKEWTKYVVSINDLESVIKYDFFNEIPTDVQEVIEDNSDWSQLFSVPNAPLMAGFTQFDSSIFTARETGSFVDTSVRQLQLPYESAINPEKKFRVDSTQQISIDQDAFLKVGIGEVSLFQGSASQIGIPHTGIAQVNVAPVSVDHASSTEIGVRQIDINHPAMQHISTTQVSFGQVAPNNSNLGKTSTHQIDPTQVNVFQNPTQSHSNKISLTSSITLQQFLSSHNFNLQNTTIPTWTEFLTGTTPFNLNIEITDRPTYDSRHNPVSSFHIIPLK
jgi:hypothetical protein